MSALLRGMVIEQAGDQLVIQATDADIVRFGSKAAVQVLGVKPPTGPREWLDDGFLYDRYGTAVVRVDEIIQNFAYPGGYTPNVTRLGDSQMYLAPAQGFSYEVRARGPV